MTATEEHVAAPTSAEEVLAAVERLAPTLPDLLQDGSDPRRLPDEVVAAVRATGLNRLLLPAELGGLQAPPVALATAIERLARADGSVAWCTAIGAGCGLFGGYVPEAAARQVFADPDATNAGIFASLGKVVVDGDAAALTGRWPFASNCLHSSWIGVGAFVERGGEVDPVPRMVFVPAADVAVHETWDALGLQATGSHDVSVDGLPVDLERSCAFLDTPWPEGTLWRQPPFMTFGPILGVVTLGIAQGALDELQRNITASSGGMRGSLIDDPLAVVDIAEAMAALRAARLGLHAAAQDVWAEAEAGRPVSRQLQAATLMAIHHVCDVSVAVTSMAHRLGGGRAAYGSSPLLRALRDVETARQHIMFFRGARVAFGRNLLGVDTPMPPIIL